MLVLAPLQAGLWTLPWSGAFIVGSNLTPMIARRVRPAFVIAGGLALSAVGFGILTQIDGPGGLAVLVAGSVVYSLGLAPVFTLATDMIVGSAPPERAGAASAISETNSEFGGALGIAILGSIGATIYRRAMTERHLCLPRDGHSDRDPAPPPAGQAQRGGRANQSSFPSSKVCL